MQPHWTELKKRLLIYLGLFGNHLISQTDNFKSISIMRTKGERAKGWAQCKLLNCLAPTCPKFFITCSSRKFIRCPPDFALTVESGALPHNLLFSWLFLFYILFIVQICHIKHWHLANSQTYLCEKCFTSPTTQTLLMGLILLQCQAPNEFYWRY